MVQEGCAGSLSLALSGVWDQLRPVNKTATTDSSFTFFYLDVGKEIQFTGEENLIKRVKDAETHTRHYDGGGGTQSKCREPLSVVKCTFSSSRIWWLHFEACEATNSSSILVFQQSNVWGLARLLQPNTAAAGRGGGL